MHTQTKIVTLAYWKGALASYSYASKARYSLYIDSLGRVLCLATGDSFSIRGFSAKYVVPPFSSTRMHVPFS